jgi:4-alpha-glucanotransferase
MSISLEKSSLHELARLYGVQIAYYDVEQRRKQASVESLLAILKALGASAQKIQDVPSAIRERRQELWQQLLEPVAIAWNGKLLPVKMRLPSTLADASITVHITLETGEKVCWQCQGRDLLARETTEVNGIKYVVKYLEVPLKLPLGYHEMTLEVSRRLITVHIISAPRKAYACDEGSKGRYWGVFVPLYALRTKTNWGGGDFFALETMVRWVKKIGGNVVATLPLLAIFFENTGDLSPYSPASRLFWNEVYIDVNRVAELGKCSSAQATLSQPAFYDTITKLRESPLFDYRLNMDLKRQVLEQLSHYCFSGDSAQLKSRLNFMNANPMVEDYARFRATGEKRRESWHSWPLPQRDGVLNKDDYDEQKKYYHIYVQWLADEQLKLVSQQAHKSEVKLYFDLPLGVNLNSYDVWRERDAFVSGVSAGAPPDVFFTKGQKWELTPLHPDGIRKQGYRYYINCLRHNLKYADILRIDHIMAFHRLYMIPQGFDANQGVYVRYHAPEFYSLLTLESHRNKAMILGEDLGTVPAEVRKTMSQYSLYRHYVVQYDVSTDPEKPFPAVPVNVVASVNTHDMPTFATFWQGEDISQRKELGLLDDTGFKTEVEKRRLMREAVIAFLKKERFVADSKPSINEILRGILAFLGSSPAKVVLVNIEDLWLEARPQNVPGTSGENLNYCRKLSYAFEELSCLPAVVNLLGEVNQRRKEVK